MSAFDQTEPSPDQVGEFSEDESIATVEWVTKNLQLDAKEVSLVPLLGAGGLANSMNKLIIKLQDDSEKSFILKRTAKASEKQAKDLGQPRESLFYTYLGPKIGFNLPDVPYAYGDMTTGGKFILMTDLKDSVQSGYFFGPYSPHNWGKDLNALTKTESDSDRITAMEVVASSAFQTAARLHSKFWKDRSLLDYKWLRGCERVIGGGEADWKVAQETGRTYWEKTEAKIASGECGVKWNAHLLECVRASFSKISWADYQSEFVAGNEVFTLVHGDFHPANMMWEPLSDGGGKLTLLDWEVVGLGSGPQDCSQYLISHMTAAERRPCEERLMREYYAVLVDGGVDPASYPWERCWSDFVQGGTCRWVWFLALLSNMCPDPLTQYFQDQVSDFIEDHGITPESIGMPRV